MRTRVRGGVPRAACGHERLGHGWVDHACNVDDCVAIQLLAVQARGALQQRNCATKVTLRKLRELCREGECALKREDRGAPSRTLSLTLSSSWSEMYRRRASITSGSSERKRNLAQRDATGSMMRDT